MRMSRWLKVSRRRRVVVERWPKEDGGVFKYLSAEAMNG